MRSGLTRDGLSVFLLWKNPLVWVILALAFVSLLSNSLYTPSAEDLYPEPLPIHRPLPASRMVASVAAAPLKAAVSAPKVVSGSQVIPAFSHVFIEDSLFASAKKAGLPDKLIMDLAKIFAWDIDFAQDLHPNDSFQVLFEEKYMDGVKQSTGNILAATFHSKNKTHSAIRFTTQDGKTSYYTADGAPMRKAFIRSPVKFSRISSHFDLHREHPILHKIRAHKGVDYAAPRGTPVKAAGDGVVQFVGRRGGYGKVIEIQHGRQYSTLYAHLANFATGVEEGARIQQGQVIGFVGSTGLATGPHLHYEFRINGVHHDPVTVALPQSSPIEPKDRARFLAHAQSVLSHMAAQQMTMLAANP